MSATKFIAELERRRVLSDRLMARLRQSLAGYDRPLSAEELANFLVQKKHLSQDQANSVLAGLTQSGVNLVEEDANAVDTTSESSIFSSQIMGGVNQFAPMPEAEEEEVEEAAADDDEIQLAPIQEELELDAPAPRRVTEDEDLPILRVATNAEDPLIESMPEPPGPGARTNLIDEEPNLETKRSPGAHRKTTLGRGKKSDTKDDKKKAKPSKRKKTWDSPLILIGGGGLTLLLLVGGTVYWLLTRQSGDHMLEQADAALKAGNYPQAVEQFENYLRDFPRHPLHSLARVQLAMVRIRQPTEGGDFAGAINAATNELKAVEDEESFKDEYGEIAALLPQIAVGAATNAEKADPTSEDSKKFVDIANQAVALYNNAAYVPKSLRDEAKLANISDTLERVARRQQTHLALDAGLKAMAQAIADKKPVAAYAAHLKLVKEHPELAGDKTLIAAIQKTTAAEQAAIRFVNEEKAAETTERPTPWRAALAVANRRVKPPSPIAGVSGTTCVNINGAVYGLDAASGRLLWRRYIGFGSNAPPVAIENDVIVADAAHHELERLDAATGRLVWRTSIGEPFAEIAIAHNRAFVPTTSGRLYVIDVKSGARTGYVQFPQPLTVAATIDRQKTRFYLPGEQGSVYTVSLADLKCIGVNHLGHAPGSIRVPAAAAMDKVAIIENDGVETCRFRLLSIDDKGALGKQVADRRLNGLAASTPIVTGRGMIIATDRGQIDAYDIATGTGANALTLVATRDATDRQPLVRYVAVTGRNVWIADNRLSKYSIVATGNRLPVEEIESNFSGDTFNHPLATIGDVLIHVRRPKNRAGFVVAASDIKQGRTLWETDVAMPLAGPPVVDAAANALVVASADGYVFRFDEAAMRSRVQNEAAPSELMPAEHPPLTSAIDLGQGRIAFCPVGSNRLLLYNPAQGGLAKWLQLEGTLASAVTPLGQGVVVPLKIGQVFYLGSADGARLATPFQPKLEPGAVLEYKPAVAIGTDGRQFVVTDGRDKMYVVTLADQPQPHLEEVKQADVGPRPIDAPLVVLGDTAVAIAGGTHILRFKLPTLETSGEMALPAPLEEGPYPLGDGVLLTTADGKLISLSATGDVKWQAPTEHGPLAGPPLALADGFLLTYRKGMIERRSLTDGKPVATANVEQPLATAPVSFLQHLIVTMNDGTLLVVDKP